MFTPVSTTFVRHGANLLLFKLNWLYLVFWQHHGLLPALVLLTLAILLHPALALAWRPAVAIALVGIGTDQVLLASGVFHFDSALLPAWLALLWLAFGLALTWSLAFLRRLPCWAQALGGTVCGCGSYYAGWAAGAVAFGYPQLQTLGVLALVWALLLPLLLALAAMAELPADAAASTANDRTST